MTEIKRAIILAAGEGSRLRPVTLETPKPLIRVNGKRIIDTGIEALRANGIHEIHIVTGYKKELFYEAYQGAEDVHIVENPYYLKGNNITSMYVARQYLKESVVLEADIMVRNPGILRREVTGSCYLASWMEPAVEWVLDVRDGRIQGYEKKAKRDGYQLWGISMWNREDGERLAEDIRHIVEDEGRCGIYWDEVALDRLQDRYCLGIREIKQDDICEIDTLDELIEMDESYKKYKEYGIVEGEQP